LVGAERAAELRDKTLVLYAAGADFARARGIIIADTKFEFGLDNDRLVLADEVLTPDSSRFWPADQYEPGRGQPSFDKQYVRDWLERSGWNKQPPVPELPQEIVDGTRERYLSCYRILTGKELG
jgi:phosphoribosylaminoimidazole-succinocarboxamide synthase